MVQKLGLFCGIILLVFAGVFTSCDKNEEIFEAPQVINQVNEVKEPQASELRAMSFSPDLGTYTVGQEYKDNYTHYQATHGVAGGFVSWWNCIARAEGAGTITLRDVMKLAEGREQTIHLYKLRDAYGVSLEGLVGDANARNVSEDMQQRLENFLIRRLQGGQPVAILIKNNYSGKQASSLVVVFTYKEGVVYYRDSRLGGKKLQSVQSSSLSYFTSMAIAASDATPKVINTIHW